MHPGLIVFDLDFTLWDCGGTWCDCLTPPFHVGIQGVQDSQGRIITLYPDATAIFDWCISRHVPMAIASRTQEPAWARELLHLLEVNDLFEYQEIYPSSKLRHFRALQDSTGTGYGQMIFFDDEMRNIREVSDLGVTSVFVEHGICSDVFERTLSTFSSKKEEEI